MDEEVWLCRIVGESRRFAKGIVIIVKNKNPQVFIALRIFVVYENVAFFGIAFGLLINNKIPIVNIRFDAVLDVA